MGSSWTVYRFNSQRKQEKANGQSFNVNEGTVFRCYVICDLTDKMRTHCSNAGLLSTADNTGYAGYNPTRHAYYEAISYQKLIADAKKRNEILFDKLFSPDMKRLNIFRERIIIKIARIEK